MVGSAIPDYNAAMTITLSLLGRPRVSGKALDLPAKAVALLGYLAFADEPQPRERILGLLWSESSEEAARKNLRNTLWAVRKNLGESAIVASADHLGLGPDVDVDVRRLLATKTSLDPRSLLELYTGPYLDGGRWVDAPEFELWLTASRERLSQVFLNRTVEALNGLAQASAWREVADYARSALGHEPLQEELHRLLMEALANLGERAGAIRQFETLRTALALELEVEPSPETVALRDAIAAGQLPRSATLRPRPAGRLPRDLTRTRPHADLPFVGREAESAALSEELAAARRGQARLVLIMGELGIGKSRLWDEWATRNVGDSTVLEARCVEAISSLPFAPLVELFSDHPRVQDLLHTEGLISSAWLAEVARLLPELREASPDLPTPAVLPPEEERRRVFEAFLQVLLALDAHPLLIFVDDVHWADRTTLDWLPYLVHRMRNRSLLLVLTYRSGEAPSALVHQVAAWARQGVLRRLALARLPPDETARLIAGLHVDSALAHKMQAQGAGNPYVLIELSRNADIAMSGAIPPALADLVRSRIDRLGEPARAVLQAAAVLEPEFDLPLLARTAARDEEEMLDLLDILLESGMLLERGRRFAFNHPLVSTVVREEMNAARWGVLNRRAAQALEVAHAGRVASAAGLIAEHYAHANDVPVAADYADLAAEYALSLAAPAESVAFRRRALSLNATPKRQLWLAQALYRCGALAEAREAYATALAMAERVSDSATAVRACLGLGDTYLTTGWADEVVQWAERSMQYLDAGDHTAHAHALFLLGAGRLRAGGTDLVSAERNLEESVRLAEAHGARDIAVISRFELGNVLAERGDLHAAIAAYRQAADLARTASDPNHQVLALNNLAYHSILLGESETALLHIAAALELAETYDLRLMLEYLFSTRGEIALAQGQWDEAEGWIARSLEVAREHNNVAHSAKCQANLGLIAQGRGDLDTALIHLEDAAAFAAPLTARYMQAQIDLWLAEVYVARDERIAALETVSRAEARLSHSHYERLMQQAAALRAALAARK